MNYKISVMKNSKVFPCIYLLSCLLYLSWRTQIKLFSIAITHSHQIVIKTRYFSTFGTFKKINLTCWCTKSLRFETHITHLHLMIIRLSYLLTLFSNFNVKLRVIKLNLFGIFYYVFQSWLKCISIYIGRLWIGI